MAHGRLNRLDGKKESAIDLRLSVHQGRGFYDSINEDRSRFAARSFSDGAFKNRFGDEEPRMETKGTARYWSLANPSADVSPRSTESFGYRLDDRQRTVS